MANINHAMLARLQADLRGESGGSVSSSDREKHHVGAVWFGDWYIEHRFGSSAKQNHNAAISKRSACNSLFTMAPITSNEKHSSKAVLIPRGMIPGSLQFQASYLLPQIKLRCRRETLLNRFTYRCTLPQDIVKAMVTILNRHRKRK